LQLTFIIYVDAQIIALNRSRRCAGIGAPVWSLAIIAASMSEATPLRKTTVIGGSLFVLVTLH
jgi:hypothetical protein